MNGRSDKETTASSIYQPGSRTEVLPLSEMFPSAQPLEVDLGCGKGRFLLARASVHQEINYLGIDRLLGRLLKIDRKITRKGITNVRLLHIEASYALRYLLPPESLSVLYILFPDPWPKRRHHRRRLFNQSFLDAMNTALKSAGVVHVVTDHTEYFDIIHELFRADRNFESIPPLELTEDEWSNFELRFRANNANIGRCSFRKR